MPISYNLQESLTLNWQDDQQAAQVHLITRQREASYRNWILQHALRSLPFAVCTCNANDTTHAIIGQRHHPMTENTAIYRRCGNLAKWEGVVRER
jgi:hypothetical protein